MIPKKTKSGKYHVTAYVGKINGKPVYKSITAPTKRECILKATEYINHAPTSPEDMTVYEAIEAYISAKERILSPPTIKAYVSMLQTRYEPIKGLKLRDLDNVTLQRFVNSLELSPHTVRNIYGLLTATLNMFTDRKFTVTLPAKVEPVLRVPTDEEVKAIMDAAPPEIRKAIILGSCSLRRGEACALKYEDIEDGAVYVHADLVQDRYKNWIYKDHAKTPQSTRRVSMPPELIKALGSGEGYVVKIGNPDSLTKYMWRLSKKLGYETISFHSLRRYYASICHALGVPDKYIMKMGGWKSSVVMKKSYQHTLDKQEKEFQSIINNHFSNL